MSLGSDLPDDFWIGNGTATANIREALSAPPRFERALDGASTMTVEVSDYDRKLMTLPGLQGRVYGGVLGFNFDMVSVGKSGDRVTLDFEDSIVAALRRVKTWAGIPASTVSRAEIVRRFCAEAGVSCLIDPALDARYNQALEAPKAGESDRTGWDVLRDLADDVDARCFSDGFNLHYGSDAWLVGLTAPLAIREYTGPVHGIDFDLDVNQPVSTATVEVDAEAWGVFAGRGVVVSGLAWADGEWIVESFSRSLTSMRGTLGLTRRRFVLAEPPPESEGDEGEIGNVPVDGGPVDIGADLARLRQCESGGNYKTNTGNGYYGAYQFDLRTWQGLGYPGRPDQASPATQDEAARKLYQQRGWKPWPACSKKLGLVDRRSSSTASSAGTAANGAREKFVSVALSVSKGKPYVWGAKGPNSFDCSGLVQYASRAAGKQLSAPSASQANAVRKISVQEALRTRGALLFRIGKGGTNHVAISLGNGSTVEARGKAQGCGVFGGAVGRTWTSGGIWL